MVIKLKRLFSIILCFALALTISACGKKNEDKGDASLKDIPTATADKDKKDEKDKDDKTENSDEEKDKNKSESDENGDGTDAEDGADAKGGNSASGGERTSASDRTEIRNNLRDARELMESGAYDDATMIINGLKTRDLTEDERKELEKLQRDMLNVSD